MIGVVDRSKSIFSKRLYENYQARQPLPDGNLEWITLLACVRADGSALPPGLIYQAAGKDVQSTWVDEVEVLPDDGFYQILRQEQVLLAIYPLHSTHTFQPLDVVCFKPLSSAYSNELTEHLHQSQAWPPVKKGDFFSLFWKAWVTSFKESTILNSFKATGIAPFNTKRRHKKDKPLPLQKCEEYPGETERAHERAARNAEKALQLSQEGKRKVSQPPT